MAPAIRLERGPSGRVRLLPNRSRGNKPGVHARPLPEVVSALTRCTTWDAVAANLPDRPPAGLD